MQCKIDNMMCGFLKNEYVKQKKQVIMLKQTKKIKIKIKIARASVNELKIDFTAKCIFNLNRPVNYYKDNVPFCYALPHFNLPKIKEFPPTCCLK